MEWKTAAAVVLVLGLFAPAAGQDAIAAARFSLTIDGVEIASFLEMDRPQATSKPATLVLKRAQKRAPEVWSWFEAAQAGQKSRRRDAVIVAYDRSGQTVATYSIINAWPSKIGGTRPNVEAVVITYEKVERAR